MKLYITDDDGPSIAIADNIEEAVELLFIYGNDKIESITSSNNYYRVEVMHTAYGSSWTTTELVNEYEIENHTVYR